MVFLALFWASPADACVTLPDVEHVIDDTSTDTIPPSAPEIGDVSLGRGQGPRQTACGTMATSCDGSGWIQLQLTATDDVSAPEAIGYRIELVDGDLPDGFVLSDVAHRTRDGELHLGWDDEATDDQEAFDFTVAIVAIDEAGNESEPVELDVSDPGSEERGCSHIGRSWVALAPAGLLAAALRRRRR